MIGADIIFRRFTVGSYPISGYLLADRATNIGVFIDPGGFHEDIAACIAQHDIILRHLFFTHGHYDHTEGAAEFMQRYSLKCHAGKAEIGLANNILHGGETIEIGKITFTALSTPGHTPGHIAYHCRDAVFTGDSLFAGSLGHTAGSDNTQQQIDHIRRHLFTLPDRTLIFPAHGPITTVAAEKYANPFMQS